MRAPRRLSFLVIAIAWIAVVHARPCEAATIAEWRADLAEVVRSIRAMHPDPFTKTGRLTFLRAAQALDDAVPTLTEEQRMVRAMQLVALIGDGHTQLEPKSRAFARWYPVRIRAFPDGFFVTGAFKTVRELAGAQVLAIAGRPAAEVMAQVETLMGSDNVFGAVENLEAVHNAALMKGLGYADASGSLLVTLKLRDARVVTRTLAPMDANDGDSTFEWRGHEEARGAFLGQKADWTGAYRDLAASAYRVADRARPPFLQYRGNFTSVSLPQSDAYYIQVVWTHDADDEGFVPFFQRAMKEVDVQKPRRLIVDFRFNIGGDGSKYARVVDELIKRSDAKPWRDLYLLTGKRCFSACIIGEAMLIDATEVTVIGEPAGAALNSFGDADVHTLDLPRTGLRLFVSSVWHQLASSDDVSAFTPVDVPVPFPFSDFGRGVDPAVNAILRGDEMRSIDIVAREDGVPAARAAYLQRKPRFSGFSWWTPARERKLNTLGYDLLLAKRFAEAIDAFRLNTEIFPGSWNTWDSLGEAQIASGDRVGGLASYGRALELNPGDYSALEAIEKARAGK